MNATLEVMTNHRSIRRYLDTPVADEQLDQILAATQAMPSSVNGQQVSVIVVRDPQTRATIAQLAGGQPWIAQAPVFLVFTMDFHKTGLAARRHGRTQVIHESSEGLVLGTFDAGIALGGSLVAAESLGLGVVPIGGIRKDPAAMIQLLGLPEGTYPVAGLVVGHPADRSAPKPRMDRRAFAHPERYDAAAVEAAVVEYDRTMEAYYRDRGDKATDWSSQLSGMYQQVYFPLVHPTLVAQGFHQDK